eukprot:6198571-Pleurochrysis_carterae.AAC.4
MITSDQGCGAQFPRARCRCWCRASTTWPSCAFPPGHALPIAEPLAKAGNHYFLLLRHWTGTRACTFVPLPAVAALSILLRHLPLWSFAPASTWALSSRWRSSHAFSTRMFFSPYFLLTRRNVP